MKLCCQDAMLHHSPSTVNSPLLTAICKHAIILTLNYSCT